MAEPKALHTDEQLTAEENLNEGGEFEGKHRYQGTLLVERKDEEGDGYHDVLTDKPRPGDRIPNKEADAEGNLGRSTQDPSRPSTTPRK